MEQHTPGPWRVENGCNVFADAAHVPLTNLSYIAVAGGLSASDTIERDKANARLIAAAPELLEALIAAESLFNHTFAMGGTVHKQMRAAIAKALGE